MKSKNLVYIHQYFKFPDQRGGTRSYDLATSFVNKGITVEVISATSEQKYNNRNKWSTFERDGLVVHYIYLPYGNQMSYIKRSFIFFKFLWFCTFKLFKLKPNIVLATSTPLTIGVPALMKKWFHKTPFIFEVRDVWPEAVIAIGTIKSRVVQRILYRLEKLIYKNASYIVPLSTDMQKSIINRFPFFKNKADIVIPNIAEVDRFQNSSNVVNLNQIIGFHPRFSVLYAGTFGRVNGLDYVVELAEKTINHDPLLVYILIGVGAYKEKVKETAIKKGVFRKNLFILDPVTKNELPGWYEAVSMGSSFVIDVKELWANSANKFFDTLAAGKPILINHEGWQAEVIRRANLGYVLPSKIDDEAAEQFVAYTYDTLLYKEQQKNALNKSLESYSLNIASENYMRVLELVYNKTYV